MTAGQQAGTYGGRSYIEEVLVITPGNGTGGGAFFDYRGIDKAGAYGLPYNVSSGNPFPSGQALRGWIQMTETAAPAGSNQTLELRIEGFASDPGKAWLGWARSAGVEKSGASATLYEFFAGASPKWARWAWSGQSNNWGFVAGTPISVRIGHT